MCLPDCIWFMRQKCPLNQKDFADALDANLTTVNRWEVGKNPLSHSDEENQSILRR